MSCFSGKCDFCDTCESYGIETILRNYNVYVYGHDIVPLKMESEKDLIPYYPYIVITSFSNQHHGSIFLSERSYVDVSEESNLKWRLDNIKRYYRSCKRKKTPFDVREAAEKCSFITADDIALELADRVGKYGEKADIDGIHDAIHTHDRQRLYEEMIAHGYDEATARRWCFGYYYIYNGFDYSKGKEA